MSDIVASTGIETTWNLFWKQGLGRALAAVFAVFAAIYLFELGPDAFRHQISLHVDRLFLPGLITLLVLRTRGVEGIARSGSNGH